MQRISTSAQHCKPQLLKGEMKVVAILLDHGASSNTESGLFGHPLQAAYASGHQGVVQVLEHKVEGLELRNDSVWQASFLNLQQTERDRFDDFELSLCWPASQPFDYYHKLDILKDMMRLSAHPENPLGSAVRRVDSYFAGAYEDVNTKEQCLLTAVFVARKPLHVVSSRRRALLDLANEYARSDESGSKSTDFVARHLIWKAIKAMTMHVN